ncbi:MAG: pectin esterase [Phycisphaerales bacterium]|nr:pectin esterase [Phycisphaerales bacterium]
MKKSARTIVSTLLICCCTAMAEATTFTVAADGSGNFKTVQEAIAAIPDKSAERTVIYISAGTYQGPFVLPKTTSNVTFIGEAPETTILTYDKNASDKRPEGAHIFNPGLNVMGSDFRAEKLTIQNTSGDHGQALAMRVAGERFVFENCRILGWQDTLLLDKGRYYFKSCYIEGRVDFIYGEGTAVFDGCEIHSKNGGFVTAASTKEDVPFGLVFLNCKLTGDSNSWIDPATGKPKDAPNAKAHLGRPWGPYGQVAFINCAMGNHIRAEGWHNWGKVENEKTARYVEFGSKRLEGRSLNVSGRVPWAKQLTAEEVAEFTPTKILGWDPAQTPLPARP